MSDQTNGISALLYDISQQLNNPLDRLQNELNSINNQSNTISAPLISSTLPEELPEIDFDSYFFDHFSLKSNAEARQFVYNTYKEYSSYRRSSGIEERWRLADKLYWAKVDPKTWPGTKKLRANLGIPYIFEQIETSQPFIESAIYNNSDGWYKIKPGPNNTPQNARLIQDHLQYRFSIANAELKQSLSINSILRYGLGVLELTWDTTQPHYKAFQVNNCNIRDFYIDPSIENHDLDSSRTIIRVTYKTISQLLSLRNNPDFLIPSENILTALYSSSTSFEDILKEEVASYRDLNKDKSTERQSLIWGDRPLRILISYSKERNIWLVEDKLVIYNQPNPYNIYPLIFAPCFISPDDPYPPGYSDVVSNFQRYATGLVNSHLDHEALDLDPPRAVTGETGIGTQQQFWYPGAQFNVNTNKDIQLLIPRPTPKDISNNLSFMERSVERIVGNNSTGLGTPRPSNANRTYGGMQLQMQGPAYRHSKLIKNIEEYLLKPFVEKAFIIIKHHTNPNEPVYTQNSLGEIQMIPGSTLFAPVHICTESSSKMITRQLLQQALPVIFGPFLQFVSSEQFSLQSPYTLDIPEFLSFMFDSLGIGKYYPLLRQKSPEEIQQLQQLQAQQQQQATQAELQEAVLNQQTRLELGKMKQQSTDLKTKTDAQIELSKIDLNKLVQDEETARQLLKMLIEHYGAGGYKTISSSLKPSSQERRQIRNTETSRQRKEQRNSPFRSQQDQLLSLILQNNLA